MGKFDHNSKRLSEDDQRAFLHLAGYLDLGARATIRRVERELVPSQKIADHLWVLRNPSERKWRIENVESLAWWRSREIEAILERAMTISLVPKLRKYTLHTTILLMRPGGSANRPTRLRRVRGDLEVILRVRYKELWNTRAAELFAMDRASVLPLIPLSKHRLADVRRAWVQLHELGDEDLLSRFLTNAKVVYDEDELRKLPGMLEQHTLELLSTTKEGKRLINKGRRKGLEKGREEGREEGREAGREEGRQEGLDLTRRAIQAFLASHFPRFAAEPALSSLDYDKAKRILPAVLGARSEAELRRALR